MDSLHIALDVWCHVIDSSVIEESPKWHLLSMVLEEIRKESAESELCIFCGTWILRGYREIM